MLAAQLGTPYLISTSGGRPGHWGTRLPPWTTPEPPSSICRASPGPAGAAPPNPRVARPVVTPRAGTSVWNVQSALRLAARGALLWPDTLHLARAGEDLIGAVRALAPYSVGWFFRDHDGTSSGPGAFETQVPGRGTLDLPGALAALQDAGFTGPAVFHAVGHIPGGKPRPDFRLDRLRALAAEARDYLSRYCTSSAERPT